MTGLPQCILAVIVVPGIFIFAMGLGDISIQALAAARALELRYQRMLEDRR